MRKCYKNVAKWTKEINSLLESESGFRIVDLHFKTERIYTLCLIDVQKFQSLVPDL